MKNLFLVIGLLVNISAFAQSEHSPSEQELIQASHSDYDMQICLENMNVEICRTWYMEKMKERALEKEKEEAGDLTN